MGNNYSQETRQCPNCGQSGQGNYCSNCGRRFDLDRISLKGVLIDVFESVTNLDKGFFYTLRKLVVAPGTMQWEYIHEDRFRDYKPFSILKGIFVLLIMFLFIQVIEDIAFRVLMR
jgi:hypothetical protein